MLSAFQTKMETNAKHDWKATVKYLENRVVDVCCEKGIRYDLIGQHQVTIFSSTYFKITAIGVYKSIGIVFQDTIRENNVTPATGKSERRTVPHIGRVAIVALL